jgi:hypothetical protein
MRQGRCAGVRWESKCGRSRVPPATTTRRSIANDNFDPAILFPSATAFGETLARIGAIQIMLCECD